MSENRDFKGVWIPKEIYLDKRLNALEKIILVEIDSLDNGENGCYASNEYLANFCQCSSAKVTSAISKLKKCGYVEQVSFDGRKRILKSIMTKNINQTTKNYETDYEKTEHNNIDNIDIDNNNIYCRVVEELNTVCGTHYKATTDKTKRLIDARIKEGFTENDFFTVIAKKASTWKGTKMEQYLRPQTLFGTKFESYLNEKISSGNPFMDILKGVAQ